MARFMTSCVCALTVCLITVRAAAQPPDDVEYTVVFDATWSAETHPEDFPSNAHFSGLIGGTHNDQVTFWEEGGLASPGMENMAETGSKSPLDDEIDAAIMNGTAWGIISGGSIPSSPGTVSKTFEINRDFPLVTLVSMVAPSPDWFVGISGVTLLEADEWIPQLVITLWPYDAGTDSGTNYTSSNQDTDPQEPITLITDGPLGNGVPLGTFTFTLESVSVGDDSPEFPLIEALSARPNPARGPVTIRWSLTRADRLDVKIFDAGGRLIRRFADAPSGVGSGEVLWDGLDDRGGRVSPGVYYFRLESNQAAESGKVVFLR